jgi:nitrogen fixation protein NifQ
VEAIAVYRWLIEGREPSACDAFDAHVVASVVGIGLAEAKAEQDIVDAVGLDGDILAALIAELFPHAAPVFGRLAGRGLVPRRTEDEECVRELLARHATGATPLEERLAAMIARRAQHPNHLWQDLGLRSRRELSWLMERHFESLAARNRSDMKWKKYLYRAICREGGFLICTAPSCGECSDFDHCFGDESGESLLAAGRRSASDDGNR